MNPDSESENTEEEFEAGVGSRLLLAATPFLLLALLFLLDRLTRG